MLEAASNLQLSAGPSSSGAALPPQTEQLRDQGLPCHPRPLSPAPASLFQAVGTDRWHISESSRHQDSERYPVRGARTHSPVSAIINGLVVWCYFFLSSLFLGGACLAIRFGAGV